MSGARVLVVDDQPADIAIVRDILHAHGIQFDVAHDVPTAVTLLREGTYDRVVLDIVISGNPNGAKLVLQAIRARGGGVRVLVVSDAGLTKAAQRLKPDYIELVEDVIPKSALYEFLPVVASFLRAVPRGEVSRGVRARDGRKHAPLAPLHWYVMGGTAALTAMVGVALWVTTPTPFQLWIFRVVVALCGAAATALLPGELGVGGRTSRLTVRAAGAFAVFVILYLVNPPEMLVK